MTENEIPENQTEDSIAPVEDTAYCKCCGQKLEYSPHCYYCGRLLGTDGKCTKDSSHEQRQVRAG